MEEAYNWTAPQALRIWRAAGMDFYGDDVLQTARAYSDDELACIAADGFTAVWVRGKLRELTNSTVFPELCGPDADRRTDCLREAVGRADRHGLKTFLYFNEPLALPDGHSFWDAHPEVRGEMFEAAHYFEPSRALCTSTDEVRAFLRESVRDLFDRLPGLGGVILITASEYLTHCWSHYSRYSLHDGIHEPSDEPLTCPRCRTREPADVVGEILSIWADEAAARTPKPRVLAWNWSWSLWYPDPQPEVIAALPTGVELMADWERGGARVQVGREVAVDEYSLGYVGPGKRFTASAEEGRQRGKPVFAKMQLGTTFELATVPNLPLIRSLFRKLCALREHGVAGIMGTWNIGCTRTLNRAVVGLFCRDNPGVDAEDTFLRRVCSEYFGAVDADMVLGAWANFSGAFENLPLSISMLYWGPLGYAPAYPLDPEYRDEPMGPAWPDERNARIGDRLEDCFGPFSLDECITLFENMTQLWRAGLTVYEPALTDEAPGTPRQLSQRAQELRCARMIGCHLQSAAAVFQFHRWRQRTATEAGLTPPYSVTLDGEARALLRHELPNVQTALQLVREDKRLGYHEEYRDWMVTPESLERKAQALSRLLAPDEADPPG